MHVNTHTELRVYLKPTYYFHIVSAPQSHDQVITMLKNWNPNIPDDVKYTVCEVKVTTELVKTLLSNQDEPQIPET